MATPSSLVRRLTLSVLMPLLLLFTQQAALLHELSHWHPVAVASAAGPQVQAQSVDVDSDFCLTCLGFAQIGGLAHIDAVVAPKLESLSYHFASESVRSVAERSLPAARSRGPPQSV